MISSSSFPAIESDDSTPKHERLRSYLLAELSVGRFKPGDALPTELELVASTGLSRNTVRQALAGLERSGLIFRVRGRGTFVHESARERLRAGLDLYGLVIPESRAGYYPSLQRGFRAAAAAVRNQVIVCDTGNDPLRQADGLLQLMDAPVAGVAIVPTTGPVTPPHQLRPLQSKNIPIVFCHRRVEGVRAPLITFSALEVGRLAGRALAARGHRRVAFFSRHRTGLAPLYEQGLRAALREAGGDLPAEWVKDVSPGTPEGRHEEAVRANLEAVLDMTDIVLPLALSDGETLGPAPSGRAATT